MAITGPEPDADLVGVRTAAEADVVAQTMADMLAVPETREDPTPDAAAAGASRRPYWRGLRSLV